MKGKEAIKLTSAAQKALEETVENYKNRVLFLAEQSAYRYKSDEPQEISVRDIAYAVNATPKASQKTRLSSQLVKTFLYTGIFYAVIGVGFVIFNSVKIELSPEQNIGVIVTLVGTVIAFVAYVVDRRSKSLSASEVESRFREPDLSMSLVQKWRDIELSLRDLVADKLGESAANKPISSLIKELSRLEILNSTDNDILINLLRLRNAIVHRKEEIPQKRLEKAIRDVDIVMKKLSKR